ncbi:MAG: hypothetical protein E7266_02225 [Lachnospiraceae bacterium]|nr:hypothetical protein [Lachnospiraceae bacterium]
MKRMITKSFILHMIGVIFSGYTLFTFNPFAIAYFGAVHSTDIIRWPALLTMGAAMLLRLDTFMAVKCIVMMVAISAIMFFAETGSRKNDNPYFSAGISALVLIAVEMTVSIMGKCDYKTIIVNLAAGALTFSTSVIFAKSLEILMIPNGELSRKKKKKQDIKVVKDTGRIARFADSLERLSESVDQLAFSRCEGEIIDNDMVENSELERMRLLYKGKLDESRKAMAEQLREMAFMINEFSKEEYEFEQMEYEREHYIKVKLKSRGIQLKRIALIKNRRNITELIITVKGTKGRIVTMKEFLSILQDGMGKTLRPTGQYRRIISYEECTYSFTEETNFLVMHGSAKAVKSEEAVSGDNFAFMELGTGRALMSLSDGMGSGFDAYKDSEMVVELLEELLDCGFSEEVAIRLINSVFLVNSDNLSPATVDMGIIDMYSGVCDFVKLGAASTFVKRGKWVEAIKSTSLPMGIFERPDMESVSKKLYNGDYIIMVSDGILDSINGKDKELELGKIIMDIEGQKPKDMANAILEEVIRANNNQINDDMTVLVTGVWERCA